MCNRVLPDFRREAEVLLEEHEEKLGLGVYVPEREVLIDEIASLIKTEHEKGWSAGYIDAEEHGWSNALETDTKWQEEMQRRINSERSTPVDFEDL